MKIIKPQEEVEVCDFCQSKGYLQTCLVCKKQFCLSCQSHCIIGCWVVPDICRKCSERKDVLRVVNDFAKLITPIIQRRDNRLKTLKSLGDKREDSHE